MAHGPEQRRARTGVPGEWNIGERQGQGHQKFVDQSQVDQAEGRELSAPHDPVDQQAHPDPDADAELEVRMVRGDSEVGHQTDQGVPPP